MNNSILEQPESDQESRTADRVPRMSVILADRQL